MKNFLFFILGVILTISIAATGGRQLFLLEPVAPISTVILYEGYKSKRLDKQAIPYLKQGYIIKLISSTGDGYVELGYMVLEKY